MNTLTKHLMSQLLMSPHTTLQMTGTFVNFLITPPLVGVMMDPTMSPHITLVMVMDHLIMITGLLVMITGLLMDTITAAIPLLHHIFCQENCQTEGGRNFFGKSGG